MIEAAIMIAALLIIALLIGRRERASAAWAERCRRTEDDLLFVLSEFADVNRERRIFESSAARLFAEDLEMQDDDVLHGDFYSADLQRIRKHGGYSGDFAYLTHDSRGRLHVLFGDVEGSGPSAAADKLPVAMALHCVISRNPDSLPSRTLSEINKSLTSLPRSVRVEAACLRLDQDGEVLHAGSAARLLKISEDPDLMRSIPRTGWSLGTRIQIPPPLGSLDLRPGDSICLSSDGSPGQEDDFTVLSITYHG